MTTPTVSISGLEADDLQNQML